jgi:hypothetical protein
MAPARNLFTTSLLDLGELLSIAATVQLILTQRESLMTGELRQTERRCRRRYFELRQPQDRIGDYGFRGLNHGGKHEPPEQVIRGSMRAFSGKDVYSIDQQGDSAVHTILLARTYNVVNVIPLKLPLGPAMRLHDVLRLFQSFPKFVAIWIWERVEEECRLRGNESEENPVTVLREMKGYQDGSGRAKSMPNQS